MVTPIRTAAVPDCEFQCPYPGCDWEPSRPIDSNVPLTQAVVSHEIKSHRKQHREDGDE